jgi:hypothetical protein
MTPGEIEQRLRRRGIRPETVTRVGDDVTVYLLRGHGWQMALRELRSWRAVYCAAMAWNVNDGSILCVRLNPERPGEPPHRDDCPCTLRARGRGATAVERVPISPELDDRTDESWAEREPALLTATLRGSADFVTIKADGHDRVLTITRDSDGATLAFKDTGHSHLWVPVDEPDERPIVWGALVMGLREWAVGDPHREPG